MAKSKSLYICSSCGYESSKWYGCCPGCGEWNTMNEEVVTQTSSRSSAVKPASSLKLHEIKSDIGVRYKTGFNELDRVLGGGIVKGSLVLLSGDPGIGKSTLLLQTCRMLAEEGHKVLYISGEESGEQIKLRADRLEVKNDDLLFLGETDIDVVRDAIELGYNDVMNKKEEIFVNKWNGKLTEYLRIKAVSNDNFEEEKSICDLLYFDDNNGDKLKEPGAGGGGASDIRCFYNIGGRYV